MDDLKRYKKRIRKLFFLSVEKDIKKWKKDDNELFIHYDNFNFKIKNGILLIKNYSEKQKIKKYRFLGIPIDFKIYHYSLKIRSNIKTSQKNKINNIKIQFLKRSIDILENHLSD